MLTQAETDLLDFEVAHPNQNVIKNVLIWDRFELRATTYYQRLGTLSVRPDVIAVYPMLANRLQRIRETNRARRDARGEILRAR